MSGTKEFFYDWMGANEVIFLAANRFHSPGYDKAMQYISRIGEHKHFPYYFAAIMLFAVLSMVWKTVSGKRGIGQSAGIWLGIFLMLGAGYATTGLVTKGLKEHFSYPRPYIALAATGEVHKLEATEPQDDFRSFPSGHVAFTTFMVIALAPVLSGLMLHGGALLIVLMAWSRMALGVHFPADVLGSIVLIAPLIVMLRWVMYTALRKLFGIRC